MMACHWHSQLTARELVCCNRQARQQQTTPRDSPGTWPRRCAQTVPASVLSARSPGSPEDTCTAYTCSPCSVSSESRLLIYHCQMVSTAGKHALTEWQHSDVTAPTLDIAFLWCSRAVPILHSATCSNIRCSSARVSRVPASSLNVAALAMSLPPASLPPASGANGAVCVEWNSSLFCDVRV